MMKWAWPFSPLTVRSGTHKDHCLSRAVHRGSHHWYVTLTATPSSENVRAVDEATLLMRTLKALLAN